ncbi:MAG: LytTR family DNA-binding domain-containing protein, partial [Bacteroidota bacterium]
FIQFLGITLAIGLPPLSFLVLYQQNRLLRAHIATAAQLGVLDEPNTAPATKIALSLDRNQTEYEISPEQILYLEANRNYVQLFLTNTPLPRNLRSTMQKMAQQLEAHPNFLRCHRAFIINLAHVTKVEGNSQGLQLTLLDDRAKIPVSRAYMAKVKARLS